MNNKRFFIIVICGLLVSNLLLIGFILRDHKRIPPHERPREIVIKKLRLDEEQVHKYDEMIREHRRLIGEKEQGIFELKSALYKDLGAKDNDVRLDSISDKISVLQKEIEKIHYRHFQDIRSLCRPDQMGSFNELTLEIAEIFTRRPPMPR
jgi:periplasmic protein CpxP/Spy